MQEPVLPTDLADEIDMKFSFYSPKASFQSPRALGIWPEEPGKLPLRNLSPKRLGSSQSVGAEATCDPSPSSRAESFHTAPDVQPPDPWFLAEDGAASRAASAEEGFFETHDLIHVLRGHVSASARTPPRPRRRRWRGGGVLVGGLLLFLISTARGKFDHWDPSVLSEEEPISVYDSFTSPAGEDWEDLFSVQQDSPKSGPEGPPLQPRRWFRRLAVYATGVVALTYSADPPGGQLACSVALGALLAGRAGAARAGSMGGALGAMGGSMLGCAGAVLVCELLAPTVAQVLRRCCRGSEACAFVGFVAAAMLPAMGLLATLLRLC